VIVWYRSLGPTRYTAPIGPVQFSNGVHIRRNFGRGMAQAQRLRWAVATEPSFLLALLLR
jgi:hypothetical protein